MNSLVNNEKQSHCIYHLTHNTHTSKERRKNTFKTQQKKNTLTLVANVCVKQEAKQQQNKIGSLNYTN